MTGRRTRRSTSAAQPFMATSIAPCTAPNSSSAPASPPGPGASASNGNARPWAIKLVCQQKASVIEVAWSGQPLVGSTITMVGGCLKPLDWSVALLGLTPAIAPIDLTPFGMNGCSATIDLAGPTATFLAFTDSLGMASLPFAIPNNPAFIGVSLYWQWAGPSLGANPAGILLSRRREFVIQ